jgi:hypothetical protein
MRGSERSEPFFSILYPQRDLWVIYLDHFLDHIIPI